jgi:hypothetical protein
MTKNNKGIVEGEIVDGDLPGVIPELGRVGAGALITERGLAALFGRHPISIKRAVNRRELPQPAKLMGEPTWTAGAIVRFIEQRMQEAAEDANLSAKTC